MTLSHTQKELLQNLMAGESIASSSLRKEIAKELLEEGLLTVRTHGSHRSYMAIDVVALNRYVNSHYQEVNFVGNDNLTRAEQAGETGNSKLVTVRSCPGFPVNSYEPILCKLNEKEFLVNPMEGSFLFVSDWKSFIIPPDVIVVGVENMENFRMIRLQRDLFEQSIGTERLLFVSRYPQSNDLRYWLQSIPNRYIHFGDFDLAGVNIFLTEFYKYLSDRSSFLIPSDIEARLSKGSKDRYNSQYLRFKTISTEITQLQQLIDIINKYHRSYDQEGYIVSKG